MIYGMIGDLDEIYYLEPYSSTGWEIGEPRLKTDDPLTYYNLQ